MWQSKEKGETSDPASALASPLPLLSALSEDKQQAWQGCPVSTASLGITAGSKDEEHRD